MIIIGSGRMHRPVGVTLLIGAIAALTAACGSSSGGGHSGTSTPPSTVTTSGGKSFAMTRVPSPAGSPADAQTAAQVKSAYTKLFAPDTPLAESVQVLQDGAKFKQALAEQAKSPLAKTSSAKVTAVRLISTDAAQVTFSILLGGSPVLPGQVGYAVREDGTWKVADVTFCGLLKMNGTPPKACTTATATTVPK